MNNYGVILKKIRTENNLTLKQAAQKISRGVGWLCEIENNKSRAILNENEFKRIVISYGAEPQLRKTQLWAARHSKPSSANNWCEGGISV